MQIDFLMREIENLTRFISKVLFQKGDSLGTVLDDDGVLDGEMFVRYALRQMLFERRLNEAENLLFDELERQATPALLQTGLWFYGEVQKLDDSTLAAADFSREEIVEGLRDLQEWAIRTQGEETEL